MNMQGRNLAHRAGRARVRMVASFIVLAAMAGLGGCDFVFGGHGVSRQDVQVLHAVVAPACEVEWVEIVSDVPPSVYRPPSLPEGQPNIQFGLDAGSRPRVDERWPRGAVCKTVDVVDELEISQALARETRIPPTWAQFHERFPGVKTLVRISLPVYSRDGRRAVVYTAATCPYTCGNGFFHELVKGPTGWEIRTSTSAWAL